MKFFIPPSLAAAWLAELGPLPKEIEVYPKMPLIQGEIGRIEGFRITKTLDTSGPISVNSPLYPLAMLGESRFVLAPGRRTPTAMAAAVVSAVFK